MDFPNICWHSQAGQDRGEQGDILCAQAKGGGYPSHQEMMLQGSTFVPSKKMKYLIEELEALILFVLRTNPGLISTQVKQASQVHSYVIDNFSHQMEEHQLAAEAATRLIDTNAIYGMMLSILLERSDRLLKLFLLV